MKTEEPFKLKKARKKKLKKAEAKTPVKAEVPADSKVIEPQPPTDSTPSTLAAGATDEQDGLPG